MSNKIFRLSRVVENESATLVPMEAKSENNPEFVYSGYVNDAHMTIRNSDDKVRCFFQPIVRRENGSPKFYGRAIVELSGSPEEIAEKATAISADPFNETWYNEASRQTSREYSAERKAEKPVKTKRTKKAKSTKTTKTSVANAQGLRSI